MVLQKLEKLVEDVGEMACLFQSVLATIFTTYLLVTHVLLSTVLVMEKIKE